MTCYLKRYNCFRTLYVAVIAVVIFITVVNVLLPQLSVATEQDKEKDISADFPLHKDTRQRRDRVIASLQHQVEDLKNLLDKKLQQLEKIKNVQIDQENGDIVYLPDNIADVFADGDSILHYINKQISKAEVLRGTRLRNEYDMKHFKMFDKHSVYQLEFGLKMRPQDFIRSQRDLFSELTEVIHQGVMSLNSGFERVKVSPTYQFTVADFLHGLYRTEIGVGTQYILIYKPRSRPNLLKKEQLFEVSLFRPFAPLRSIATSSREKTECIHFIVPLQGRADTLRVFLDFFKDFALPDGNIHLTVVYFGGEDLDEVNQVLRSFADKTTFTKYNVLNILNEEFSRGKALQRGADSIQAPNPLLFFCDVDIGFTADFLNQCRAHATAGVSVFYPIVFSLYNPAIVYHNQPIPSLRARQVIKNNNGLWRDFGFGMTCQYLSDLKNIGGFDLRIKGWGSEDTLLYRKYTQSTMIVIRTPVDSLFHHWHSKNCDKLLPSEQYVACLRSRARNEGSQLQLGLRYYNMKDELEKLKKT